jgi:hypothetical protein
MPITTQTPAQPDGLDLWPNVLQRMMPYKDNGQDLDQWLIGLVEAIVKISPEEVEAREIEIDRFFKAIHILPNLHLPKNQKFSDGDREAVRDRILNEVVLPKAKAQIHQFYPTGKYLAPTLGTWVNLKLRLYYECLDAYQNRRPDAALDNDQNGANERLEWEAFAANPTLSGLDIIIAQEQAKQRSEGLSVPLVAEVYQGIANVLGQTPTQRFITYIKDDPQGVLRAKSLPDYSACTYQVLIQRLFLNREDKKTVAADFGIPYQNLYAHYTRHVFPAFIQRLILEEGFFEPEDYDKLRHYIDQDPLGLLQNCHKPRMPQVNAQFLAQQRLRICRDADPAPFEEIWNRLIQQQAIAPSRLDCDQLEKFWVKTAFPLVAQEALRVLAYDLEV